MILSVYVLGQRHFDASVVTRWESDKGLVL